MDMIKLKFNELKLSPEMTKAITDMGFEEATPIQSLAIPAIMEGKDITGQAQTGTGKTAAFGIPILEMIDAKDRRPQALVLCPTRELAIQVAEELKKLGKYKRDLTTLPVYGGQPIFRQIHALQRGVQVIIGTPGRVMDHLQRNTLTLAGVKMIVLDEADEMLDMGFREDIETILKSVPKERQTVFFSATMPRAFMELTRHFQKDPQRIKIEHDKVTAPDIEQIYFEVREFQKLEALTRVIDRYDFSLALVFCNTKWKVDEVTSHLQARGYFSEAIHGDMNQTQRDRVMAKFRNKTVEILVATDVAARGIDVEDIDAVFNYDVPQDEEYYVHRIGRTGRAGKSGRAFTFASGRDLYKLREIQRFVKGEIRRAPVPTLRDVEETKTNQLMDKVRATIAAPGLERYTQIVERFVNDKTSSLDVAAALLKILSSPTAGSPTAAAPMAVPSRAVPSMTVPAMTAPSMTAPARAYSAGTTARGPYRGKETFSHPRPEKAAPSPHRPGSDGERITLIINVGRSLQVGPSDIVGAIAGETGLAGSSIGPIRITDDSTFVGVPADDAGRVIRIMRTSMIRGNKITIRPVSEKYEKKQPYPRKPGPR